MKGLQEHAVLHIQERPKHIDLMGSVSGRASKIIKMAETLKMIDRSKCLTYDENEFAREFSGHKNYGNYLKKRLIELGIKKPRFVRDQGKVYIWRNDD